MKETFNSLRVWFILFGSSGIFIFVSLIENFNSYTTGGVILIAISAILRLFFLFFGIKLREILPNKIKLIRIFIILNGVFNIITTVISYTPMPVYSEILISGQFINLIVSLSILTYLYKSVGKISENIKNGIESTEISLEWRNMISNNDHPKKVAKWLGGIFLAVAIIVLFVLVLDTLI